MAMHLSRQELSSANNRFELAFALPTPLGVRLKYRRYIKRKWWLFRWEYWDNPGRLYSADEVEKILEADDGNGSK